MVKKANAVAKKLAKTRSKKFRRGDRVEIERYGAGKSEKKIKGTITETSRNLVEVSWDDGQRSVQTGRGLRHLKNNG